MSRFGVTDKKELELFQRMERLGIFERDLKESFIKGSGKGGQKLNKSNSCVQLTHTPSGLEVRSQKERSQSLNRFFARIESALGRGTTVTVDFPSDRTLGR